jgi:sterol desaturase/sphingolipid hydroxylase (fatty acid hydroxylase superfamily)
MALIRYTDDALNAVERWSGIMSAPSTENRKRIDGIQVLKNRTLERIFATSHWAGPLLWFGPLLGWTLHRSLTDPTVPLWLTATLVVSGILGWTLIEYILHRWVFHAIPKPQNKLRQFMMHGYHHEFPSDRLRLVAPPALAWPIAIVIVPLYYALLGPHLFAALTAGTAIGYLAYDWIHYYTHHARPTTRVGRFLRRYHMEHHFKDQSTHFGLSSPLWDLVFGTYSRPTAPAAQEIEILGNADEEGPADSATPAPAPVVQAVRPVL